MVYRNIRYRLYPKSRGKADLLCRCMGATRYVWNHFLGLNKAMMEAWRKDDSNPKPEVSFFSIRSDWQHRESRKIADRYQYAAVEDLNARGMTKSAQGTVENPGKSVKAKSGLNREILKTGWSGLRRKLAYKMEVVEVDPKNTSRTCHECGHVDRKNRKTQSRFGCVSCGHSGNADINAALNILALGTRATGQGGRSGYGPGELSRRYRDGDVVNYSL
ncbi:MAG: transposase [Gammaproteobacteria bacterium]|nr:transposase [Gammaproteobacteria bacterium]